MVIKTFSFTLFCVAVYALAFAGAQLVIVALSLVRF